MLKQDHKQILLIDDIIAGIPEEAMMRIAMSSPWQSGVDTVDPDGYSISATDKDSINNNRESLQAACWSKYFSNPQVNTSVRGTTGRIVGSGFDVSSEIPEIQATIKKIIYDKRNRLYHFLPVYVTRNILEGELFLVLTLHDDGFVEVDFVDPASISNGSDGTGIMYHPNKPGMPLMFTVQTTGGSILIPSINVAYFPELKQLIQKQDASIKVADIPGYSRKAKHKSTGGFTRFMVYWDRGLLTKRSAGHLRTTLEWLNKYENLKNFEIDHKKSSGSYVWAFEFQDVKAFKLWLSLTEDQRRNTGIMAKMMPGGKMVLPPGMSLKVVNPQLPKISDSDTDILHMITAGLNEPEDVSTGQSKGTFASVKASRGPMSDRTADEIEYFRRFFTYDFWSAVFHLKSSVTDFPKMFPVKEAIAFKDQEPVFGIVEYEPENLIAISFPTSEVIDYEGRAKGFLGVKHGSVNTTLGVSNEHIANKIGIANYSRERLKKATEDDKYPELILTEDDEAAQEKAEAEPGKGKKPAPAKPEEEKSN